MKNFYAKFFSFAFLMMFVMSVLTLHVKAANEDEDILSLDTANISTTGLTVNGTTGDKVAAVLVELFDSTNNLITMKTFPSNGGSFSGSFDSLNLTEGGNYSLYAKNFNGQGESKEITFDVPANSSNSNNNSGGGNNGNSSGNNSSGSSNSSSGNSNTSSGNSNSGSSSTSGSGNSNGSNSQSSNSNGNVTDKNSNGKDSVINSLDKNDKTSKEDKADSKKEDLGKKDNSKETLAQNDKGNEKNFENEEDSASSDSLDYTSIDDTESINIADKIKSIILKIVIFGGGGLVLLSGIIFLIVFLVRRKR
ncbi:MAG: hypothetical protein J6X45_02010 [Lachnospiraceae bacterium]|nr:hypothetical protein [Lachnospiraceae bacterium]